VEVTEERLTRSAAALILTAHSAFDYDRIVRSSRLVFDTRNATRQVQGNKSHVFLL